MDGRIHDLLFGRLKRRVFLDDFAHALSDRILVQRMGKVVEEYSALEATEEKIMYAAIH